MAEGNGVDVRVAQVMHHDGLHATRKYPLMIRLNHICCDARHGEVVLNATTRENNFRNAMKLPSSNGPNLHQSNTTKENIMTAGIEACGEKWGWGLLTPLAPQKTTYQSTARFPSVRLHPRNMLTLATGIIPETPDGTDLLSPNSNESPSSDSQLAGFRFPGTP